MGYYTQYKLESVAPHSKYQTIKDALSFRAYPVRSGDGPDCGGLAVSPWIDDDRWGNATPGCKWYSMLSDAEHVSKQYPDVEFTISKFGEDDDGDPSDPNCWTRITWNSNETLQSRGQACIVLGA